MTSLTSARLDVFGDHRALLARGELAFGADIARGFDHEVEAVQVQGCAVNDRLMIRQRTRSPTW